MANRNHAWFTFNLSKGHGLPCGARARVRPLWAEQWVLIVLLVGVVGLVLGHGNWDGGGEELAPLPGILEAAERTRLLLIPYIYKQDRHKEKNCREIWTQTKKEWGGENHKNMSTSKALKDNIRILRDVSETWQLPLLIYRNRHLKRQQLFFIKCGLPEEIVYTIYIFWCQDGSS